MYSQKCNHLRFLGWKGKKDTLYGNTAFACAFWGIAAFINMKFFVLTKILSLQVLLSAFDADASLDVLDHPVLNFIYYMVLHYTSLYMKNTLW